MFVYLIFMIIFANGIQYDAKRGKVTKIHEIIVISLTLKSGKFLSRRGYS